MNLQDFSLLKEDNESYHVGHPNGKMLVVGKKGLSDKAQQLISKMKRADMSKDCYATAGTVGVSGAEDNTPPPDTSGYDAAANDVINQEAQVPPMAQGFAAAPLNGANGSELMGTPVPGGMDQAPQSTQDAPPATSAIDPLIQASRSQSDLYDKQEKDIKSFLTQEGSIASGANNYFQNYLTESSAEDKNWQERERDFELADQAYMKTVMDGKIDPQSYYKNMKTGSKIGTAISLALSGLGAGLTHGSNLALDQINRAVDQDIQAQQFDQNKNMNLWKMNHEAMGDARQAHLATRNQMFTGVQAQIAMMAQQSKLPEQQLQGKQLINQIEQQKIQNRRTLGLIQAGQQGSQGGLSSADPAYLLDMVPEAQRPAAINAMNKLKFIAESGNDLINQFDRTDQAQTLWNRAGGIRGDSPEKKSLRFAAQELIKDNNGKPNELQNKILEDVLPGMMETSGTTKTNRAGFVNFIQRQGIEAANTLKASGIPPGAFQSLNLNRFTAQPKQDQYRQWAEANANLKTPEGAMARKYLNGK